jgi:hypothetical protein
MGLLTALFGDVGTVLEVVVDAGKDVYNAGKDAFNATKSSTTNATKSAATVSLLPKDVYSYSDLVNSEIHYAKYLNTASESQNYVEPNFYNFHGLIHREISKDEVTNSAHGMFLTEVYKIFLYNYCGKSWGTSLDNMEEYLKYSLPVVSAILELTEKGIDLYEKNAAEKRARELFREYFPDLFEQVTDEKYKTAIHCILHGKYEEVSEITGFIEDTNQYIVRCINLIKKHLFLSENPDVYVKRGYKSYQEDLQEIEEKRKREEEKRLAKEKKKIEEKERKEQKRLKEAEKQKQLAEEQKKKDRLLHADDDL